MQKFIIFILITSSATFAQTDTSIWRNSNSIINYNDTYNYKSLSFSLNKEARRAHSPGNIIAQFLVGSVMGPAFAFFPAIGLVVNAFSNHGTVFGGAALGILTISSYIFGAGVGTYWVADSENPELPFWSSIGYSALGGGMGVVILALFSIGNNTIPAEGTVAALLCPTIGSMIYTTSLADWSNERKALNFNRHNSTLHYIVEQTKLFNVELMRINF